MSSNSLLRSRRSFLAGATTVAGLLAGCVSGTAPDAAGTDDVNADATSTNPTTDATTDPGTTSTDPDTTTTPCPDRDEKTLTYDPDADCPGYRMDDLVVFPPDDRESTIHVRIVRLADDAVILDETVESDGEDPIEFRDPITETGPHRITVSLDGGPEGSYEWDVPKGEARSDSYGLQASVGTDEIAFTPIVH